MASVADFMTSEPGWLDPEQRIQTAWEMMREHRVRHVPICKDGRLVGLITQKDLFVNAQSVAVMSLPVAELMIQDVITITTDVSLRDAAILLRDRHISCVPVVDANDQLLGILTDTDLLSCLIDLLE